MADLTTREDELAGSIASTIDAVNSDLAQAVSNLQLIALDLQRPAIAGLALGNNVVTLQSIAGALQKHTLRLREMIDPLRSVLRPEQYHQAGVAAAANEQFERAAVFFHRALELREEYPEVHKALGDVLSKQGKLEDAVVCYERALALKPDFVEARILRNSLGNALQAQGKPAETTNTEVTSSQSQEFRGFYINLDRSIDRREKLEAHLRSYDLAKLYRRFPAADGNILCLPNPHLKEGELGCYTSHYLILKQNLESAEHLHIIEDDVIFSKCAHKIMNEVLVSGRLAEYDIIFTDIFIPILNREFKWYKDLYDRLVECDANGKIRKLSYDIINLKGRIFYGTASYLVSSKSISKIHELLHSSITNSPRLPIDLTIRRWVWQGLLKAGCIFPFITAQRLEYTSETTIADRWFSQRLVMPSTLAKQSFFVDCDFDECNNYAAQYLECPTDSHRNLLSSILGHSLTKNFQET